MRLRIAFTLLCACITGSIFVACKHKPPVIPDSGYPPEIADIIVNRCAISGCHNQSSFSACDSLLLDTWDHMFQGDNSGAVVVPFRPEYSTLLYFVNTDSSLGPVFQPLMPYQAKAPILSRSEYQLLADWIAKGAPDKNGNIPFAEDAATRQKIYCTNQDGQTGIDLMAVIDAKSNVIMRYLTMGSNPTIVESGHCVKFSDDGSNAYVGFYNSSVVQKFNTTTDQIIGSTDMPKNTGWSIICLDSPNTRMLISNWTNDAMVASVNTNPMSVDPFNTYEALQYPHGIVANKSFDTFFAVSQFGNTVYKLSDPSSLAVDLSLDGHLPTQIAGAHTPDPHDIIMTPDYSRYFVTCQNTNDVRVMDAHTDTLIKVIPVGAYPQEFAISLRPSTPYIFVTCMQDSTGNTVRGTKGSVYVIDYRDYSVKSIWYGDFFQPHAITVDDRNGKVFVFSTNANGVPQHHAVKGQRDGWYSIYDLNTLRPLNTKRYEMKTNPYSAATRFRHLSS
ncbi:MAG: YncE family protein [Flavipsychrobacter sp.]